MGIVLVTPALLRRRQGEGIADKELSATPSPHCARHDIRSSPRSQPLLGSRSGLSTAENPMADVAAKLAELVALLPGWPARRGTSGPGADPPALTGLPRQCIPTHPRATARLASVDRISVKQRHRGRQHRRRYGPRRVRSIPAAAADQTSLREKPRNDDAGMGDEEIWDHAGMCLAFAEDPLAFGTR